MSHEEESCDSYQVCLRSIGAYLDELTPTHFTVIEQSDGFLVTAERGGKDGMVAITFTRPELQERHAVLQRQRGKSAGSSTAWSLAPVTRQNLLRALGFELDEEAASLILVDETEDGLLVTYSMLEPEVGYTWKKRLVLMRQAEAEQILTAAEERRPSGFARSWPFR